MMELMYNELGKAVIKSLKDTGIHIKLEADETLLKVVSNTEKILADSTTDDFEKIDLIVQLFIDNGLETGGCHDF